VTVYRIPPPARSGPATGNAGPEHWLCGIAASYERWPQPEYTFQIPPTGLPLYIGHEEKWIDSSGMVPGEVGAARRFAEIDGVGLVTLIEVAADHATLLWDVAEGRRSGLSIGGCLDPPPGGGPEWLYIREVSLTEHPADPRARVISSGELALRDWEVLTGEHVPAAAGG
jgi:hypothetical protein